MNNPAESFLELLKIVARLRDPNGGCPWDLEQTHESLRQYMIEEAYEAIEAIEHEPSKLHDELGDVLLQVVLHSQIASEAKTFTIEDVIRSVSDKMIRRHPHVFGEVKADTSDQVLKNWETIKQKELAAGKSILDGVPRGMPALLRAQRVGDKAARVGFEWHRVEDVRDKVLEEVGEFLEQCLAKEADQAKVADEFGDILFSLTQLARRMNLDSEDLLHRATEKFSRRFKKVEARATPSMREFTLDQLDALWNEVKAEEKEAG